jgi:glycosyltransferase involved in cell wall biosynthesis
VSRLLNFRRFQRAAAALLPTVARPGDILVVMTDPPLLAAGLAPLARKLGLRLVPWVQDIYPEIAEVHFGAFTRPLLAGQRQRRGAAWQGAAACVTLGDDMRRVLLQSGVAADRATIIPNWAPRELDQGAPADAILARRRDWGLEHKFVAAYSGNLGRVHEFSTLLDAAARLAGQPDITLLFIGRGPRFDEVKRAVAGRGLTNVRLLPPEPRERLAAALAAADAHLVTLRPEYASLVYPSKLAGTLAASRPVLFIGPPEGDIGRLLGAAACGAAFSPGDAAGVADTLARWQADAARREQLGANARATYARQFSFAAALTRWDELLRQVAARA